MKGSYKNHRVLIQTRDLGYLQCEFPQAPPAYRRNEVILTAIAKMSLQLLIAGLPVFREASSPVQLGELRAISHRAMKKYTSAQGYQCFIRCPLRITLLVSHPLTFHTWRPSVLSTVLWTSLSIYQCPLNTSSGLTFTTTWEDSHPSRTWNQDGHLVPKQQRM